MSEHVPCRWCRPLGFLISGLLHLALIAAFLWSEPGTPDIGDGHVVRVTLAMFRSGEVEGVLGEKPDEAEGAGATDPEPKLGPDPQVEPESQTESDRGSASGPRAQGREQRPKSEPRPGPKPAAKSKPKPEPKSKTGVAALDPSPQRREGTGTSGHALGSPRAAATGVPPEGGTGDRGSSGMEANRARAAAERDYLAELRRAIAGKRFYPVQARRRGLDGVATVSFVIRGDGRIADIRIVGGSGSDLLDSAAIETMKRLGSFKPIPSEFGREHWPLRVPIDFALR